ncbi:MAG: hypothetical protein QOJ02_3830 [Acidobacteriota bacterium]|jgi:formylglycine-generating enzyme required for sulfatase activity|nr:hypothetical protein [Acidobacteriota bacterium]
MGLARENREKRQPTLLIPITLSTLLILWLATGFAMTQKRGRGAGSSPPSTQGNANQQTTAQQQEKKILVSIKNIESPANTSVTITANEPLNDYSAYRSGNRYYVVIPNADAPQAERNVHGRGYDDMQVQKRGNDIVLSFRLQPGVNALVQQKFNRLEVVFKTSSAAAKAATTNSNANPTPTSSPVNGSGKTREQVNAPLAKRPLRKEQLIQALRVGGVSSSEYVKRIRERGVDFELTPAIEKELRAAGASSAVIEAIRANYRPPVSLPTPNPTPPQARCVAHPPTSGTGREYSEDLNGVKLEMVEIPAGSFCMGSPDGARESDEHPQHQVTVQNFYMGKYEVTQAQYQAVMGTNPSEFKGDNLPVENVSWDAAKEFCRRLSQITGKEYRLPSEAEWEYACRAGTTEDYAGNPDAMAWYGFNSRNQTHPVGQKQANGWGLYDMYGNVWESCEDIYQDNYNGAPTDGSAWLSRGDPSRRVIRGGAWGNVVALSSATRFQATTDARDNHLGFRLAAVART